MGTPYLGEIRIMSFDFAPRQWALCNGQLLPIIQNQPLFSLLGTTFGGDGRVNFGLPDLRDRVAIHKGDGHSLGEMGGEETHALSLAEMPEHTHQALGSSAAADAASPAGALWADNGMGRFAGSASVAMAGAAVSNNGGSLAHNNASPFLTLRFCIALAGDFPSQT